MNEFDYDDYLDEAPEPFWTTRRIVYAIIAIIIIVTFLLMTLYPAIIAFVQQRPPIPTPFTPLPRV